MLLFGTIQAMPPQSPARRVPSVAAVTMGTKLMPAVDIWRDTNHDELREEWKSVARMRKSVREAMDGYTPRNRDSAKRMKQCIHQIRLDASRTWASHSAFSTDFGRKALERVLVSWVAHNPRVGYCQSFNFLAAMILAVCKGNEDETLAIFSCLLEDTSFGDYFQKERNFEALHEDTQKLEQLLVQEDLELSLHLESIDFQLVSITPTWLLTCFFLHLDPDEAIVVLDQVLKSGNHARSLLIDTAVDILQVMRDDLLSCSDLEEVFVILKSQRRTRSSGNS